MGCQISPPPEQICLSLLSPSFHCLLPFSTCLHELSKHTSGMSREPHPSRDGFAEPNLGFGQPFDEPRRQSLLVHAASPTALLGVSCSQGWSQAKQPRWSLSAWDLLATGPGPHLCCARHCRTSMSPKGTRDLQHSSLLLHATTTGASEQITMSTYHHNQK